MKSADHIICLHRSFGHYKPFQKYNNIGNKLLFPQEMHVLCYVDSLMKVGQPREIFNYLKNCKK